eukprot:2176333-Rhodomonas_salina.1
MKRAIAARHVSSSRLLSALRLRGWSLICVCANLCVLGSAFAFACVDCPHRHHQGSRFTAHSSLLTASYGGKVRADRRGRDDSCSCDGRLRRSLPTLLKTIANRVEIPASSGQLAPTLLGFRV